MPINSQFPRYNHSVIVRIEHAHRRRQNFRKLALDGLAWVTITCLFTWIALAIFA